MSNPFVRTCMCLACHYLFMCSVNTRVGNELGAGNPAAARLSVYTCAVMVALVHSLITVVCRCAFDSIIYFLSLFLLLYNIFS